MSLERRLQSKPCPRQCVGTIMTGEQSKYNAVSSLDGKQICSDCKIDELIGESLEIS